MASESERTPWDVLEESFPSNEPWRRQVEHVLEYGCLAPAWTADAPWRFALASERVEVTATAPESLVDVGRCLQNVLLAARAFGMNPSVNYCPDPYDEVLAASITLDPSTDRCVDVDPLFTAIGAAPGRPGDPFEAASKVECDAGLFVDVRLGWIATGNVTPTALVKAGQLLQRLHLAVAAAGFAVAPAPLIEVPVAVGNGIAGFRFVPVEHEARRPERPPLSRILLVP